MNFSLRIRERSKRILHPSQGEVLFLRPGRIASSFRGVRAYITRQRESQRKRELHKCSLSLCLSFSPSAPCLASPRLASPQLASFSGAGGEKLPAEAEGKGEKTIYFSSVFSVLFRA